MCFLCDPIHFTATKEKVQNPYYSSERWVVEKKSCREALAKL